MIEQFALSIKEFEGWIPPCRTYPKGSRSFRTNNPGNFRYAPLIKELGATGKDDKGFAIFPDYETGFNALKTFIQYAKDNKLKAYKNKTILGFFKTYAPSSDSNDPKRYATYVAQRIGKTIDTKMSDV